MEQVHVDHGMHARYSPFDIIQTLSKTSASICLYDCDSFICAFALARHVSLKKKYIFQNHEITNGYHLN